MLIEIELGALLAVEIVRLGQSFFARRRADASAASAPALSPAPAAVRPELTALYDKTVNADKLVEIVKMRSGAWVHVGHRAPTHPDVAEALTHPELAVRHADGTLEGVK